VAIEKGAKVVNLYVSELGYNPYTSVLVVSEKTLKEKPDLVAKIVAASQEGWSKYLDNAHATDSLLKKANSQVDQGTLDYGHAELLKLCRNADTEKSGVGVQTAARWNDLRTSLVALGVLKPDAPSADLAWTGKFLPAK